METTEEVLGMIRWIDEFRVRNHFEELYHTTPEDFFEHESELTVEDIKGDLSSFIGKH